MGARIKHLQSVDTRLSGLIEAFLLDKQASMPSEHTMVAYGKALRYFREWAAGEGYGDLSALDRRALLEYLAWLRTRPSRRGGTLGVTTIRDYANVVRTFAGWLVEEQVLDANPFDRVRLPRQPRRKRAPVSDDDMAALLRSAEEGGGPAALRDVAIILVLHDTGLRVSELVSLRADAIRPDGTLSVIGKGNKQRTVRLGRAARRAVTRYLRVRTDTQGAMWAGTRGPLTPIGVRQILARHSRAAGIAHVHPHRLRNTFAVRYLQAGGDVYSLKDLMGHETLTMLMQYVSYDDRELVEAHRKFSPSDKLKW